MSRKNVALLFVSRIKKNVSKTEKAILEESKICHSLHEKIRSCLYWALYMKTTFFQVMEGIQWFVSKRSVITARISDLAALLKAGKGELNQNIPLL